MDADIGTPHSIREHSVLGDGAGPNGVGSMGEVRCRTPRAPARMATAGAKRRPRLGIGCG